LNFTHHPAPIVPPPLAADCVVNAAGFSVRMGDWKMMLPFGSGTLLDACLANALVCCERVILVGGVRGEELIERYSKNPRITTVINPIAETGLFSSIQCGLRLVERPYVFIAHGDMPCLTADVFNALWQARCDSAILPTFEGQNGHPVLLPRSMAQQMASAPAWGSARQWLMQAAHQLLPVPNANILLDIDTPEQYQRLLDELASGVRPGI
jgi:molybdenum cofactor cytidylyltransferase